MSTEVSKPKQTALASPLIDKLKAGIAESRATTVIAGGKPFLRMLKELGMGLRPAR